MGRPPRGDAPARHRRERRERDLRLARVSRVPPSSGRAHAPRMLRRRGGVRAVPMVRGGAKSNTTSVGRRVRDRDGVARAAAGDDRRGVSVGGRDREDARVSSAAAAAVVVVADRRRGRGRPRADSGHGEPRVGRVRDRPVDGGDERRGARDRALPDASRRRGRGRQRTRRRRRRGGARFACRTSPRARTKTCSARSASSSEGTRTTRCRFGSSARASGRSAARALPPAAARDRAASRFSPQRV